MRINRRTKILEIKKYSAKIQSNRLKYKLVFANFFLSVFVISFFLVLSSETALAATPYQASYVLGQTDFNSSDTGTTANSFGGEMTGVAVDETNHRLFVGDYNNARVLVFNLDSSNKLLDKTADYVLGQPNFTSNTPGSDQAAIRGPSGLAFDAVHDRLFVSDGYNANNRVLVFDLSGGISDGMDASWVLGQTNFTNNGQNSSQNEFANNGSVSYDKVNDRLFVADYGNNRVLVFDLSGGISDGMDASWVLGQTNFTNNGSQLSADGMNNPWAVYFDTVKSRLYVSDFTTNRVLVFDLSGGISDGMDASWVLGRPDFTSNNGGAAQNRLSGPLALTSDDTGNLLFVHDGNNGRVMIFDTTSLSNGKNAVGVLGKAAFDDSTCQLSRSGMCDDGFDASMYFNNSTRSLYVSDSSNHRVLIFDFANIDLGDGSDSPVAIPNATFEVPYTYQIPITGDQGNVSCELTSGSLPKNVTLTNDCVITGTPASNTVYNFIVTVTDDNGIAGTFTDSQAMTLIVNHASGSLADTGDNPRLAQYFGLFLIAISFGVLSRYFYSVKIKGMFSKSRNK